MSETFLNTVPTPNAAQDTDTKFAYLKFRVFALSDMHMMEIAAVKMKNLSNKNQIRFEYFE